MANLAVPTPASETAGNLITGALWNANVYNGLTYLLNPPIYYAVQNTSQNISNTTNTAITFDTEIYDTYAGHNNSTNNTRYTAQVAGYYLMSGCVAYAANANGVRLAKLRLNGTDIKGSAVELYASNSSNLTTVATCTIIQFMNVNDYVEVATWQNSGATIATSVGNSDQLCSMTVTWIHA